MRLRRDRPVRLLTLTTLFPNAVRPRQGIFVANRLRHLRDTGRVEASVIAAVPWFPGSYREAANVPLAEAQFGFAIRHPRYVQIPAIGMRIQPDSLAKAVLADLRKRNLSGDAFDLIDAHYFYPDGVAAARVARELGLPLVITARGSDINVIGQIPFARHRMLMAASEANALIAVSRDLATRMCEMGMPADRTHVLRNGVDTELFAPLSRERARQHLGLDERGTLVLGVGNLVPGKGFDLLIRAVAMLTNVRLLLIGNGPSGKQLKALAHDAAPGRVEFREDMSQKELRFAYAASNALGLPSLREGWPNVVLEAIACGTPVIASPVGGIPEMLGPPDAPGRLVPEREPKAWASAIRDVLETPFAPEALRKYALRFGWEEVIARQCALYESITFTHFDRRA